MNMVGRVAAAVLAATSSPAPVTPQKGRFGLSCYIFLVQGAEVTHAHGDEVTHLDA